MKIAAVVVAAGLGTRFGGDLPKQYRLLSGLPVISRAIHAFERHEMISEVMVVINALHASLFEPLGNRHHGQRISVVFGGSNRSMSVRIGLEELASRDITHVLVHDGARPLVCRSLIDRVTKGLSRADGVIPVIRIADALWEQEADQRITAPLSRPGLVGAQTPQGFAFGPILAAHREANESARDDAEIAVGAGMEVQSVPGSQRNFKITEPGDLARAELYLQRTGGCRVGNGFDVHRLVDGDTIRLCGVDISHDRALAGHSDADVALHAITDAIYGALAEGDIGRWFPPTDPAWKGTASGEFLMHARDLAHKSGYEIAHIDCTIICEQPRIAPYAREMQRQVAALAEVADHAISIKATTTEGLGLTGRNEGIAALATATLLTR